MLLVVGAVAGLVGLGVAAILGVLLKVYYCVAPKPPLASSQLENHIPYLRTLPYYQVLPDLFHNLAWERIGQFPTPLQKYKVKLIEGQFVEFWIKRESLSHPSYGGNKVRTLEFQLGSAKAKLESLKQRGHQNLRLYAIGGAGSNQCVATALHGQNAEIPTGNLYLAPEAAHKDNAWNLLSCLNFPFVENRVSWTSLLRTLRDVVGKVVLSDHLILPPGGANPVGVVGHIGGILELLAQVKESNGKIEEPTDIFLALGSSCTTAGLLLGIGLAHSLNLGFRDLKKITIHAVPIHHAYARIPFLVRWLIKKLIKDTYPILVEYGKLNVPGVLQNTLTLLEQVEIPTNYAGVYGKMSPQGEITKSIFEEGCWVEDDQPKPWMCACFTSKSGSALLDFLKKNPSKAPTTVFWETKSVVQPPMEQGWKKAQKLMEKDIPLKKWILKSNIQEEQDLHTFNG
eukprot:TRINITY_DN1390_c0_g1_i1.p1 TRINITY_DN1390_c0_g1~~TRINITY_DN1390_c0_g1_i1.p1  ORF type:complete len:456 (+),score=109.61 TRINITY_DN1390_c0_g1_i1:190-1557(+)